MSDFNRKEHWEHIYSTKSVNEVSWYQPTPETSLELLKQSGLPLTAALIDIGGGDSFLVDHWLELGYENITVLDISAGAIERAKTRLGTRANRVKWVVADAADFQPLETYDFWHDRAAFHFLTQPEEVKNYVRTVGRAVRPGGHLVIGTFSENGPLKCSGITIRQYSAQSMTDLFKDSFQRINCFTADHRTPFDTVQNFVFCRFQRKG